MRIAITLAILFGALFGAASPTFAQAPVAVPAATPTLWSFLGIPQGVKKVQGALTNRRGNLPKTEPKNALKALNDPANLLAEDKAIKKAAKVKVAEDLKPQKIKAIKYLTSIGCGCYDKDSEVTDALIASAEDCTEDVRLATMQGIQSAAANKCCSNCGQVCCCNEKMLKKLAEVAYEKDETGCHKEPSKRVREAAAAALKTCCPNSEPPCVGPEEPKDDGTRVPDPMGTEGGNPKNSGTMGTEGKSKKDSDSTDKDKTNGARNDSAGLNRASNGFTVHLSDAKRVRNVSHQVYQDGSDSEFEQYSNVIANPNPNGGVVISLNSKTRIAHVHFTDRNVDLAVGDEVYARTGSAQARGFHGRWLVVSSVQGCIRMKPIDGEDVSFLTPGDHVFAGTPPVMVVPASYRR